MYIILLFVSLLLSSSWGWAQSTGRSVSVTLQLASTPYEAARAFGLGVQLFQPISQRLALTGALGMINGGYVVQFANFSVNNTERSVIADLSALYLTRFKQTKYQLHWGGGFSLLHNSFAYAALVHPLSADVKRTAVITPMLHLVVDQQYEFKPQWHLFARTIVRSAITERQVIDRNISANGFVGTSGGIRNQFGLDVGIRHVLKAE